ncbi:hypothetical protein ACEK07_04895 [Alcanivoracaceae bacterium MT1]
MSFSDAAALLGKVKLRKNVASIPKDGLAVSRHRVELVEKEKPDLGWIAELTVLGRLPWYEGEERKVEIRIMSQEFGEYVASKRPLLLIRRGNEIVGEIEYAE